MADFNIAVEKVLLKEGGFIDNPSDSGGATNFGISLRFLREIPKENLRVYGIFQNSESLNIEDIKNLTFEQAWLIYKGEFWNKSSYEELKDQKICNYIFDCSVLHGTSQAIKIAQRALWAVYHEFNYMLDDGIMGVSTILRINATTAYSMLIALRAERAGYMKLIIAERSKDKEFLNGWLKRCYQE